MRFINFTLNLLFYSEFAYCRYRIINRNTDTSKIGINIELFLTVFQSLCNQVFLHAQVE